MGILSSRGHNRGKRQPEDIKFCLQTVFVMAASLGMLLLGNALKDIPIVDPLTIKGAQLSLSLAALW